jgi:hypothetical protein
MNIISIIKEEFGGMLSEGLSRIVYHFTYSSNLANILKTNKFATSSNLGSQADSWKDKGRFYFFSTQRTKGMAGYGSHHGNTAIVLDGQKLNQKYKGFPTDYWNWSKKRSDYPSIGDYTNALQSEEHEDRIVTNEPFIDNAKSYMLEIHVLAKEGDREYIDKLRMQEILDNAGNIPIYFYDNNNNFKLQNKLRAVPPEKLGLELEDEKERFESSSDYALWAFEKVAPYIILKNNIGGGYNDERDALVNLLKSYYEKVGKPEEYVNDKITELDEKVKKLGSYWLDDYEQYRVLSSEIHNNRGNPNPFFRELLKMLINDMRKWKVKDLKQYVTKKLKSI